MYCFKFKIGQIVEQVKGQKEYEYTASIIRRFIKNERTVQEIVHSDESLDGDLYKVHERHFKADRNNVLHDLYLCQNLKTQEFTLFGRSGLREHIL